MKRSVHGWARAPSLAASGSLRRLAGYTLLPLLLATGCAAPHLNSARSAFRAGQVAQAEGHLAELPSGDTDRVLALMERGTIRQSAGRYEASAADFLEAVEKLSALDYLSVLRGTAGMLTSDEVKAFRGYPYERTLLHAFAAKNYLALSRRDSAAVEARNIIDQLESREKFPDDPYSRYLAGFCLELSGDPDGARRQYEAADRATAAWSVKANGSIGPTNTVVAARTGEAELVCFVGIGNGPDGRGRAPGQARWGRRSYARILIDGRVAGRSYALSDTRILLRATERRLAAARAAKDISRLAVKYGVSAAVESEHEGLGALLWLILLAFENRPERRWETLPMSLQVARVPCPATLREFTVEFVGFDGSVKRRKTVTTPLSRYGRSTWVSFCRDIP